jgi:hypothetical protein
MLCSEHSNGSNLINLILLNPQNIGNTFGLEKNIIYIFLTQWAITNLSNPRWHLAGGANSQNKNWIFFLYSSDDSFVGMRQINIDNTCLYEWR